MDVASEATEVEVVRTRAAGLPPELQRRNLRVLRPRDASDLYHNPREELARLAAHGLLKRLAPGYYAISPPERAGDAAWRPSLEASAWGMGAADYGVDDVALVGPSAARLHGLLPRAIATAWVGVPARRPALRMLDGTVRFVMRDVSRTEVEAAQTELGPALVTTIEQTALDLAARRDGFDLPDAELEALLRAAVARADWDALVEHAREQHRPGALSVLERVRGGQRAGS